MLSAHALKFPCSAKGYKKVANSWNMQMTIVEWNTQLNHHRTSALLGRSRSPIMHCIASSICSLHGFFYPLRACAARVSTWFVIPSVRPCVCHFLPLSATKRPKSATLINFSKNTALESYGVKIKRTSQYANYLHQGCLLGVSLKVQEVTMKGVYQLPHAIYYCG